MTLDEIRTIARADFDEAMIPNELWDAFWAGYLTAIKRYAIDADQNRSND